MPNSTIKPDTAIKNDSKCFCCGNRNEKGLQLKFTYPEDGSAETSLVIPEYFTGWENLTHGGFISMLLDETMAHACLYSFSTGVTAEMTIKYKHRLPVGTKVIIKGRISEMKHRIAMTEGEIKDAAGTLYATASAKFIKTG